MGKPSAAMIIALLALFVALGGVGVAASGDNFILGQSNSASSKTSLTAGVNDRALVITNNNTGSNAAALGLTVAPGHVPLTVSSSRKVTNLNVDLFDDHNSTFFLPTTGKAANSDKLDGIDSTGFVQGRGSLLANRMVVSPDAVETTLLTVPGLGSVKETCTASGAFVDYINTTAAPVDFFRDTSSGGGLVVLPSTGVSLVRGTTFSLGTGSSPGALRTAVVSAFGFKDATTSGLCHFEAQDVAWTSP